MHWLSLTQIIMIIDQLFNAHSYYNLHKGIAAALHYLQNINLPEIAPGKYAIDGEKLFAIVQEYDTLDMANEKMESHRKYIDVQYMIAGEELVGHALLINQIPVQAYDEAADYMLFGEAPAFFSKLQAGMFMIFFPTDLHMPCIKNEITLPVKKIVIKVAVE
jgi:YhcH/YjgK/YiaL family protein